MIEKNNYTKSKLLLGVWAMIMFFSIFQIYGEISLASIQGPMVFCKKGNAYLHEQTNATVSLAESKEKAQEHMQTLCDFIESKQKLENTNLNKLYAVDQMISGYKKTDKGWFFGYGEKIIFLAVFTNTWQEIINLGRILLHFNELYNNKRSIFNDWRNFKSVLDINPDIKCGPKCAQPNSLGGLCQFEKILQELRKSSKFLAEDKIAFCLQDLEQYYKKEVVKNKLERILECKKAMEFRIEELEKKEVKEDRSVYLIKQFRIKFDDALGLIRQLSEDEQYEEYEQMLNKQYQEVWDLYRRWRHTVNPVTMHIPKLSKKKNVQFSTEKKIIEIPAGE